MRIPSYQLGVFVPATWTVPQNPITGGMGNFGEFVPATWSVPQNPITGGMGDFVPAMFTVPQNPVVWDMARGADGIFNVEGESDCGCGCGGTGGCGGGVQGLGGITDDMLNWANGQWSKITAGDPMTIALWGGSVAVLAYLLFFHRSGYKDAAKAARERYRKELAELRVKFPTAHGRARRAAAAF